MFPVEATDLTFFEPQIVTVNTARLVDTMVDRFTGDLKAANLGAKYAQLNILHDVLFSLYCNTDNSH